MDSTAGLTLPDNVSPEQVRDYPYGWNRITDGDPFAPVAAIHQGPAIFYSPEAYIGGAPAWVFRRAADARKLYLDTEHFSTKDMGQYSHVIGETWSEIPIEVDPPMHSLYRAFMNPAFTPAAMTKLEGHIRDVARKDILAFRDKGECEFMSQFAWEFPIKVFLELMGLPLEMSPQFLVWSSGLIRSPTIQGLADTTRAVATYLRAEIKKRRENPTDDLISYCVKGQIEGRGMTDDELLGFALNLFIGGMDTVSNNLGHQIKHLATRHDHQSTLRDNPEKIPAAIEEFMRAFAGISNFRTCIKETEVDGVRIKVGDRITLATMIVSRDPEEYPNPDEIILDRNPKHVAFGYGVHLCLGLHLARREMRIALEELLSLMPEFSLAPNAKITSSLFGVITPDRVPLVWKP